MRSSGKHWDATFSGTEDPELGWYEKDASQTLELLNQIPKWENSTVFLPGAESGHAEEETGHRTIVLAVGSRADAEFLRSLAGHVSYAKWQAKAR